MISHNGQTDSITPDEIVGVYEIITINNAHSGYFLCGCDDDELKLSSCYYLKS